MEDTNWKIEITEKSRKQKLKLEEIAIVQKSKLAVQETVESLNKGIEKYLAETEKKRDFTALSKSNAFRNSVKDKQQTLTDLTNAQKKLEEESLFKNHKIIRSSYALLLLFGLCFSSSFYLVYNSAILKNFVYFFLDYFEKLS